MNEEIKALIERETQEYSERIKKNTNFNSNERIAALAAFKRGASIISEAIINQFRWRKVEEELPEEDVTILIKNRVGQTMSVYKHGDEWCIIGTNNLVSVETIEYWMPIPNN